MAMMERMSGIGHSARPEASIAGAAFVVAPTEVAGLASS